MVFLNGLFALYRFLLTAAVVMSLSSYALIDCWEPMDQENRCLCEQLKSESSEEVSGDQGLENDFTPPEDDLIPEIVFSLAVLPVVKSTWIQVMPFASPVGLNSPPPEWV